MATDRWLRRSACLIQAVSRMVSPAPVFSSQVTSAPHSAIRQHAFGTASSTAA